MKFKKKFIKRYQVIVTTFLLITSANVYAMQVKTVYRSEKKGPDIVFKQGLIAVGTNVDFIGHIYGETGSGGNQTEAFISTSSNPAIPDAFARRSLIREGSEHYIYTIRATDNMYYARQTVDHIFDVHHREFIPSELNYIVAAENEYTAYLQIPATQIRSVRILRRQNGEITEEVCNNPNYIDLDTRSNAMPFTGADHLPIRFGDYCFDVNSSSSNHQSDGNVGCWNLRGIISSLFDVRNVAAQAEAARIAEHLANYHGEL